MTTYGVGNKYCLDLESLWDMFEPDDDGNIVYLENRNELRHEYVEDTHYYDLYSPGALCCMDGEIVKILEENENSFKLLNSTGEEDVEFIMSRREFEIACKC